MTIKNLESKDSIAVCPCVNCICVPVCRHKPFHNLYHDCSLICQLFREDYEDVYLDLQRALNPTLWKVERRDKFKVVNKGGERI